MVHLCECDFFNLYLSEWTLTGWLKARARINCSSQSDWRNSGPFKGCQSIAQQRRGLMTHHLHEDNQNRGVHHLRWGTRCLGHWQMYSTQSFPATVSVSIYHIINMHLDSRLSISIPAHSFIMFFDLCFQSRIVSSLHLVNRRTLPVFARIRLDYVQTFAELLCWSVAGWENVLVKSATIKSSNLLEEHKGWHSCHTVGTSCFSAHIHVNLNF